MKKLSLLLKYLISRDYRDYRYVRTLHLFDPDYYAHLVRRYLSESYDLNHIRDDPLWSYFIITRKELKEWDFPAEKWRQFCDPHPLFDTYFYVSRYRLNIGTRNPFAHYLIDGWKQGLQPSPFFESAYYADQSGWSANGGDPLTHYVHHGLPAGLSPAPSFDIGWYVDRAPYPEGVRTNAIKHYKLYGAQGGKSPVPVFEARHYLDAFNNDRKETDDPFLHYVCAGEKKGVRANSVFDGDYYGNRYLDGKKDESPLLNYLQNGVYQQAEINARIECLLRKPVISIIVPVFNPELRYLRNCIRSVLYQSYPYWELCLVDDCSDDEAVRDEMRAWAAADLRITCIFNSQNSGISVATQAGVESVGGEFVAFLDNDDELALDSLFLVAAAINVSGCKIFYSDEDLVGDDGSRHTPFFKPAFNKALLLSHNYITHFVVVSRSLFIESGGFKAEFDGAQDYDLMLKLADTGETFHHIPHILYHWRAVYTSTSIAHKQKPYAHEAGRRALEKHLIRNNIEGRVTNGPINFHYRIELPDVLNPTVTVIVAGDDMDWIEAKTDYKNASFHLINMAEKGGENNSDQSSPNVPKIEKVKAVQDIIERSSDEWIAILGHGASDLNVNWLRELVSKTTLDRDIGIVCGRVSYKGTDGPSFAVTEIENDDAVYYAAFIASASRHAQGVHNMQWVNSCDWHICVISRKLLGQVGGFDYQRFTDLMAMQDLSYRAAAAGKKILYVPDAVVTLLDDAYGQPKTGDGGAGERAQFIKSHHGQLLQFEQYYNIGSLIEQGESRESFYRWLTGTDDKQD